MKTAAAILALMLLATPAVAQEGRPDFSRDTLTRLFAEEERFEAEVPRDVRGIGYVDVRAFGVPFRFNYLATMAPLSGSEYGLTGVSQQWPDPFSLTGTQIATSRRAWRTERAKNAELRRINRLDRRRFNVSVSR